MPTAQRFRYSTERLLVDEWHSLTQPEWPQQDQARAVVDILTPRVVETLPPPWQGPYTIERAQQWVSDRNKEGRTLLAIDRVDQLAIGMIILFEGEPPGHWRLGYVLKESAWGKGFASELISGFVKWCRCNEVDSLTGGVEHGNIASIRVLEKCGFLPQENHNVGEEQMFVLNFSRS